MRLSKISLRFKIVSLCLVAILASFFVLTNAPNNVNATTAGSYMVGGIDYSDKVQ